MWETRVLPLSLEGPLEKEMATVCSILAWRIPWTEEPGGLQSIWCPKESDMTEQLSLHFTEEVRQHTKVQRHHFADIGPSSQSYVFSRSHVQMWELDHKESWTPKNCCFQTAVLEKTLENHLDFSEIKPVHPKGNQSWMFIGRTDAEAEIPVLWPPDAESWLIGKDPEAGQDGRREEKGTTEDEMPGWHHRLNGHESE